MLFDTMEWKTYTFSPVQTSEANKKLKMYIALQRVIWFNPLKVYQNTEPTNGDRFV